MEQKSYSIRYRDDQSKYHQLHTLASDSYQAKTIAMEKVQYLNEHPHAIDNISLDI